MSPAPKSKSKDKLAAKAAKEQMKASIKPSAVPTNGGNGAPTSAYNPIYGTFHALDNISLATSQQNGRFRTIDETEGNSRSSLGMVTEFDASSNNGSCSGESEDQKEKTTGCARGELVPGCDTDKREKIRQKNERKHQRQKERRAQELHERCSGYLMSSKLDILVKQLVAMGFSSEQATMALILNEGRPEESVTWLFEGGLESKQQNTANFGSGANLKIDITDELAKIADMETRYKCMRQEVERAVVASEGDLEKAEETLKAQKLESEVSPTNVEELRDYVVAGSMSNKIAADTRNSSLKIQQNGLVTAGTKQLRRDEGDLNYSRSMVTGAVSNESLNRNLQSLRKSQTKPDMGRPQIPATADKRWSSASPTPPISYSSPSSLQVPVLPTKSEVRHMLASHEAKASMHASTLRDPDIVMQRPHSVNAKQNLQLASIGAMSPPTSTGWQSNGMCNMEMLTVANSGLGHGLSNFTSNAPNVHQFSPQNHFQEFLWTPMEANATRWSFAGNHTASTSPLLSVPSSLGLFTGWGTSGSASSADWSNVAPKPRDYTSIDWSVDSSLLRPSGKSGLLSDTWSTKFMGGEKAAMPAANGSPYMAGIQDMNMISDTSSSVGSHEWTSPFAGKDLFRVPRQFVTSPTL